MIKPIVWVRSDQLLFVQTRGGLYCSMYENCVIPNGLVPLYDKNTVDKLQQICQDVHDRLLRGDDDRELLALLEKAWKG